jgi:hypothetical protein
VEVQHHIAGQSSSEATGMIPAQRAAEHHFPTNWGATADGETVMRGNYHESAQYQDWRRESGAVQHYGHGDFGIPRAPMPHAAPPHLEDLHGGHPSNEWAPSPSGAWNPAGASDRHYGAATSAAHDWGHASVESVREQAGSAHPSSGGWHQPAPLSGAGWQADDGHMILERQQTMPGMRGQVPGAPPPMEAPQTLPPSGFAAPAATSGDSLAPRYDQPVDSWAQLAPPASASGGTGAGYHGALG